MKTMYRTLCALAALAMSAGTLALAAPAHAAPVQDDAVTISLDGLNPADPADAATIGRRIRGAARDLCGSDMIQPLRLKARAADCRKAAIADAQAAVEVAAARQGGPFRLTLRSE
jgi:UrcA family protein